MTNYENVTQSPKVLSDFLSSLPIIEGPWNKSFQKTFCSACKKEDCEKCPNEEQRNNPEWWLQLEVTK